MTERTGTAPRPRPLSRAKRSPAIPDTGNPLAMANLTMPEASWRPPAGADPVRRLPVADDHRPSTDTEDEHEEAETEDGPVEVEARRGIDGAHRPERRQW